MSSPLALTHGPRVQYEDEVVDTRQMRWHHPDSEVLETLPHPTSMPSGDGSQVQIQRRPAQASQHTSPKPPQPPDASIVMLTAMTSAMSCQLIFSGLPRG